MKSSRRRKRRRILFIVASAAAVLAVAAFVCFGFGVFGTPAFLGTPAPSSAPTPGTAGQPSPGGAQSPSPSAVQPTDAGQLQPKRSLYEVALTVFADDSAPSLEGAMRLTYLNQSEDVLYEVKLHLYPDDVSPGSMVIDRVAVNDEAVYYTLSGENQSMLNVPLPTEIAPGETARIFLTFRVALPKTGSRFGINETGIMLGNVLPIAAVYENGAWRSDAYVAAGDAFYSACADYKVAVSAPEGWELAYTGSLVEKTSENRVATWYISAAETRDFALALMKNPRVEERRSDNGYTTIYAFGRNRRHAEYLADAAAAALSYFENAIGGYPYDTFFVVPFDQGGGMEYPGLIMVSEGDLKQDDLSNAALVVGHETAHQWFYALVGSDQINAPWLDESLVEFLGFDFLRAYLGEEAAARTRAARFAALATYARTMRIDAPLYDFAGNDYFYVVYASGYALYEELFARLGSAAFYGALQTYFDANSFSIARAEDLYAAFSEAAGEDLTPWFEQRLAPPQIAASPTP